jgi:arylsulfatase A-like enzyme
MMTKLDQAVGQLIRDLDDNGMLENSVVIFSSDNGGTRSVYEGNAGSNYPLRGEKITPFEGGTRAAGLLWSTFLKAKSRIAGQLMHITDWVPTLWALAGTLKLACSKVHSPHSPVMW